MNISESVISSGFVHLIAVLIVAAVTNSSGSKPFPNAITVDLTREAELPKPEDPLIPADASPPEPLAAAENAMSIPDVPAADQPTEKVAKPEPQRTPQAAPQNMSADSGWYQDVVLYHTRVFAEKTGVSIQKIITADLDARPKGMLNGASGRVGLFYTEKGALEGVEVFSDNPAMKKLLEQIGWHMLAAPGRYSLGSRHFEVRVLVVDGIPYVELYLM